MTNGHNDDTMKIKEAMKIKNMTVADLARAIDVDYGYTHRIVHDKRIPSPTVAADIEAALGGLVTRIEILYPQNSAA